MKKQPGSTMPEGFWNSKADRVDSETVEVVDAAEGRRAKGKAKKREETLEWRVATYRR